MSDIINEISNQIANPPPPSLLPPMTGTPSPVTPSAPSIPPPTAPVAPIQTSPAATQVKVPTVLKVNVDGIPYKATWTKPTPPTPADQNLLIRGIRSSRDHQTAAFGTAKDPATEAAIANYTQRYLTDPDNTSIPNQILQKVKSLQPVARMDAIPAGLSPIGKLAIMRATLDPDQLKLPAPSPSAMLAQSAAQLNLPTTTNQKGQTVLTPDTLQQGTVAAAAQRTAHINNLIANRQTLADRLNGTPYATSDRNIDRAQLHNIEGQLRDLGITPPEIEPLTPGRVLSNVNKVASALISGNPQTETFQSALANAQPSAVGAVIDPLVGQQGTYQAAQQMPGFLPALATGLTSFAEPSNILTMSALGRLTAPLAELSGVPGISPKVAKVAEGAAHYGPLAGFGAPVLNEAAQDIKKGDYGSAAGKALAFLAPLGVGMATHGHGATETTPQIPEEVRTTYTQAFHDAATDAVKSGANPEAALQAGHESGIHAAQTQAQATTGAPPSEAKPVVPAQISPRSEQPAAIPPVPETRPFIPTHEILADNRLIPVESYGLPGLFRDAAGNTHFRADYEIRPMSQEGQPNAPTVAPGETGTATPAHAPVVPTVQGTGEVGPVQQGTTLPTPEANRSSVGESPQQAPAHSPEALGVANAVATILPKLPPEIAPEVNAALDRFGEANAKGTPPELTGTTPVADQIATLMHKNTGTPEHVANTLDAYAEIAQEAKASNIPLTPQETMAGAEALANERAAANNPTYTTAEPTPTSEPAEGGVSSATRTEGIPEATNTTETPAANALPAEGLRQNAEAATGNAATTAATEPGGGGTGTQSLRDRLATAAPVERGPGALTDDQRTKLEAAMSNWRSLKSGEGEAPVHGGRNHGIGDISIGAETPVGVNVVAHEFAHAFDDVELQSGGQADLSRELYRDVAKPVYKSNGEEMIGHRQILVDAPGFTESGKWMVADGHGGELLTRTYASMVESPGMVEKYAPEAADALNRAATKANLPTPAEARVLMGLDEPKASTPTEAQVATTEPLRASEPAATAPTPTEEKTSLASDAQAQAQTAASGVPEGTPVAEPKTEPAPETVASASTMPQEEAKSSAPPSGGGGETAPTEAPKPEEALTGGRNAITEYERQQMGLPEVERQPYTTMRQAAELGRAAVDANDRDEVFQKGAEGAKAIAGTDGDPKGPLNVRKVAEDVARDPRPLDARETGALIYDKARLINESETLRRLMTDAKGNPTILSELGPKIAENDRLRDLNQQALVKGGREQSAAFNARKMFLKPDYTLAESSDLWRANNGGAEIPSAKVEELRSLYEQLDKAKADLTKSEEARKTAEETLQKHISEATSNREVAEIAKEVKDQQRVAGRVRQRQAVDSEWNDLKSQLRKAAGLDRTPTGGGKLSMALDPTQGKFDEADLRKIVPILVKMARNRAELGTVKTGEIIDAIHKEVSDLGLTKRQISDAISGYGNKATRQTSQATTDFNNARKVMRLTSMLEDARNGETVQKGTPPGKPSPEVVAARKLLDAELKRQGKTPEGLSKAELAKVQKQIADLKAKRDGTAKAPTTRSPVTETPELKAARAERDALRKEIADAKKAAAEAAKPKPPTPEERLAQVTAKRQAVAENALVKRIADVKKQIDAGGAKPPAKSAQPPLPETPRMKALNGILTKLQTDLDTLRNPPLTDAQKLAKETASKQAAQKTSLENQIKDLDKRIAAKDTSAPAKTPVPSTPEIEALKAERATKQAAYDALPEVQAKAITDKQTSTLAAKQRQLDTLNAKIASGDFSKPAKSTSVTSPEIESLNRQIADAQKQYDDMKPPGTREPLTDQQRLDRIKANQQKTITQLEDQLKTGNPPSAKRAPVAYDAEAKANQAKIAILKAKINHATAPNPNFLSTGSALFRAGLVSAAIPKVVLAHSISLLGDEASRPMAAAADIARVALSEKNGVQTDRIAGGASIPDMLRSGKVAIQQGIPQAMTILRHGGDAFRMIQAETGNPEDPYNQMFTQKLFDVNGGMRPEYRAKHPVIDAYLQAIGRSHEATYHVFKTYALARSLMEQAKVGAISAAQHTTDYGGLSRADFIAKRTEQLMETPSAQMAINAIENAEEATFVNDNTLSDFLNAGKRSLEATKTENGQTVPKYGLGGKVAKFGVEVAAPVAKIPANIVSRIFDYTGVPGAYTGPKMAIDILRRSEVPISEQNRFVKTFGKATTGAATVMAGYLLAKNGLLTGNVASTKERKEMEEKGIPEQSLKIGGSWHNIGQLAPIGPMVVAGANLFKIADDREKSAAVRVPNRTMEMAPEALGHLVSEQPLFSATGTVNDVKEGLSEGTMGKTMGTVAAKTAASVVPQIVQQTVATFDPLKRDITASSVAPIFNALPYLRETLPPKTTPRGQGIPETKNFYDPTQTRTPGSVPLSAEERSKAIQLQRQKADEKRQRQRENLIRQRAER